MKYLDYCYLCINNRKDSELSETPLSFPTTNT